MSFGHPIYTRKFNYNDLITSLSHHQISFLIPDENDGIMTSLDFWGNNRVLLHRHPMKSPGHRQGTSFAKHLLRVHQLPRGLRRKTAAIPHLILCWFDWGCSEGLWGGFALPWAMAQTYSLLELDGWMLQISKSKTTTVLSMSIFHTWDPLQ